MREREWERWRKVVEKNCGIVIAFDRCYNFMLHYLYLFKFKKKKGIFICTESARYVRIEDERKEKQNKKPHKTLLYAYSKVYICKAKSAIEWSGNNKAIWTRF